MTQSSAYWKQRFEQIEQSQHQQGLGCCMDIEKQYCQAQKQLEGQLAAWYQRFADNNKITLAEAHRLLTTKELAEFKWDVNQYIQYGQENAINGTWMKQLENASARFHINRLEALKIQTQQAVESMFRNQLDSIDSAMKGIYTNGYYHTAYEIQKGVGVGWDFSSLDDKQIQKVINKPWAADGKNFSERVWGNCQKLVNELNTTLTQNIILGKDPQKAIDEIAKKMNTSKNVAGRLVMTEEAAFSSAAQKDCFNELDVEQFEIVATLDSHTSKICQEMDGKHFPMSKWEVGTTAPPFHVWCRTATCPFFDDEFDSVGERAARDKDGKTYYVPSNMTYSDWEKSFVDGDKSGLQPVQEDDTIKAEEPKYDIEGNTTKLKSALKEADYQEYLDVLNNHPNTSIKKLYSSHADEISGIKFSANGGCYVPSGNRLEISFPLQKYVDNGKDKFSTIAHEYGHFFDAQVTYPDTHFNEIDTVQGKMNYLKFKKAASSSDEFLEAVRKDKQTLRSSLTEEIRAELKAHDASDGVQDAIDGLTGQRIMWGHGDKYYNRKYASVKKLKEQKGLQEAYKELGFDVSNQGKVSSLCRDYESASEMWANIMAAETNGGESLECVKKYLPNSYKALLKILEGAE